MGTQGNVHLVGSVGLKDAESVFRTLAETVGSRAKRYPDGETDERGYWIRWQKAVLDNHPQFTLEAPDQKLEGFKDDLERNFFRVADGVDPADLTFETLGYADYAKSSYAVFARLKSEGVIPPETRFQVSIPTALALVSGFIVFEERAKVEGAYERALKADIDAIAATVPHDQLAIQWDVCFEVVGHDGGYPIYFDDILGGSVERVVRHCAFVPENAEVGIHLCYGDPGHQHIVEPKDIGTSVAFANAIAAASPRPVQWVHMPVPRERSDDAYFAALDGLKLPPETELYLGLVHLTDGAEGTSKRMDAAAAHVGNFGLATECGFGRRDPGTIPDLLRLHNDLAGG